MASDSIQSTLEEPLAVCQCHAAQDTFHLKGLAGRSVLRRMLPELCGSEKLSHGSEYPGGPTFCVPARVMQLR